MCCEFYVWKKRVIVGKAPDSVQIVPQIAPKKS